MNKLNTLYFPDTAVFSEIQYPLFLLIDKLHYLSPIEISEENEAKDIFVEQGFCQVHTPLPLGEDRERFIHLLKDIQLRKDDYVSQLSALTIEGLAQRGQTDDESKNAIMASLLGGEVLTSGEKEEELEAKSALWQARLVLALGETLDREEEELASHLSFWDEQEMELFKQLQGESEDDEDNPFQELLDIQQKVNTPNPVMMKNRCKAWQKLMGEATPGNTMIWVATRQEAVDYLFDEYEKKTGNEPYLCDKLQLPASIGRDMPFVTDSITEFHQENSQLLETIAEAINGLTSTENQDDLPERPVISPTIETQWDEAVEKQYPENLYGRKGVRIYFLKNFSATDLIKQPVAQGNGILIQLLSE